MALYKNNAMHANSETVLYLKGDKREHNEVVVFCNYMENHSIVMLLLYVCSQIVKIFACLEAG